jgi:hypothetical protein
LHNGVATRVWTWKYSWYWQELHFCELKHLQHLTGEKCFWSSSSLEPFILKIRE